MASKERFDRNNTSLGRWQYQVEASPYELPLDNIQPEGVKSCFHTRRVIDPLGNETEHYFQTGRNGLQSRYGLPFTLCDPETGAIEPEIANWNPTTPFPQVGPFLSRRTFDPRGRLLREVRVDYDVAAPTAIPATEPDAWIDYPLRAPEKRLVLERTDFYDRTTSDVGPIRYRETRFENHDGLGHFRRTIADGNFPLGLASLPHLSPPVTEINYNPRDPFYGGGTYDPNDRDPEPNDFVLPAVNAPWVLATFDRRQVSEFGSAFTSLHCFDRETGALVGERRLTHGETTGTHDVLVRFDRDLRGQVIAERRYGGDNASFTARGCEEPAGMVPSYHTTHAYQHGVRAGSWALDGSGQPVLTLLDTTIDPGTGLVASSRDAAGIVTTRTYDRLGRLSAERPTGSAWTEQAYHPDANPPRYEVHACAAGSSSCKRLADLRFFYDDFGRMVREHQRLPDGTFTFRATGWDKLDRAWCVSEWHANPRCDTDPVHRTPATITHFDALSRPTRILLPNHGVDGPRLIDHFYSGVHSRRTKTTGVALDGGGNVINRIEGFDIKGRLVQVHEYRGNSAGGDPDALKTAYAYDAADRLMRVCIDDNDAHNGCTNQKRRFVYDGRGFLIRENHPEIDGRVARLYDAAGNVILRDYDASGLRRLRPHLPLRSRRPADPGAAHRQSGRPHGRRRGRPSAPVFRLLPRHRQRWEQRRQALPVTPAPSARRRSRGGHRDLRLHRTRRRLAHGTTRCAPPPAATHLPRPRRRSTPR